MTEDNLELRRTTFDVSVDELWMAAREGEDSETIEHRLATVNNRFKDLIIAEIDARQDAARQCGGCDG